MLIHSLSDYIRIILKLDSKTILDSYFAMLKDAMKLNSWPDSKSESQKDSEEFNSRTSVLYYGNYLVDKEMENLKKNVHNLDLVLSGKMHNDIIERPWKIYYRGQYNSAHKLKTGIYRGDHYKLEDYYYHEILVRCSESFKNTTQLEKLTIMQHYGLPTRLLDITANPLTALYFACKKYSSGRSTSRNGVVYIFIVDSDKVLYADSDKALILSSLPHLSWSEKSEVLRIAVQNLSKDCFPKNKDGSYQDNSVEKLYHEICRELPAFKRELLPIDVLKPVFVQPEKNNARMIRQDGAFIITGISMDQAEEEFKLKLLTPVQLIITNREKILNELDKIGINEASLMPEIESVADYLKSQIL